MFQSSNKPKFALEFTINDLSNIPHVGGSCYIDMNIRDSLKSKLHLSSNHTLSVQATLEGSKNSIQNKLDPRSSTTHSSSTPSTVSAVTSKRKIHNFKCSFNFQLSCNLRFPFKKKENLIGNKYLVLTIYYLPDLGHHLGELNLGASELGRLEINLSEYLNFKEATTFKYLLKKSKVNSIISLTVSLRELPSDFEFHTQLQISEQGTQTQGLSSRTSRQTRPTLTQTTHRTTSLTLQLDSQASNPKFNVPNFEKKNVFGGISEVIHNTTNDNLSPDEASNSDDGGKEGIAKMITLHLTPHSHSSPSSKGSAPNSVNANNGSYSFSPYKSLRETDQQTEVMMEPIVMNLYKKILEASWDPELYKLLDYTPEKIVESIFREGEGWTDNLFQKMQIWTSENTDEDGEVRELNGLINEVGFREDLRSWKTSVEH